MWEEILLQFALHQDIDFAYLTQRFYTLERPEKGTKYINQKLQFAIPPPFRKR